MGIEVLEWHVDVQSKIAEFEMSPPTTLVFLPLNIETVTPDENLLYPSTAPDIELLFQEGGFPIDYLLKGDKKPYFKEDHFFTWIGPTLFVTTAVITQNSTAISIALNLISSYLFDFFKGIPENLQKVKLNIVLEKHDADGNSTYKNVSYEGPQSGITKLNDTIREVYKND